MIYEVEGHKRVVHKVVVVEEHRRMVRKAAVVEVRRVVVAARTVTALEQTHMVSVVVVLRTVVDRGHYYA